MNDGEGQYADLGGPREHAEYGNQEEQGNVPAPHGTPETSDPLDDIIREVALRHGICLGRDDPILMTYTINQRIMQASAAIQGQVLERHLGSMKALSGKLQEQMEEGMEKTLREAAGSMQAALREEVLRAFSQERMEREELRRAMREEFRQGRHLAVSNTLLSVLALVTAALLLGSIL